MSRKLPFRNLLTRVAIAATMLIFSEATSFSQVKDPDVADSNTKSREQGDSSSEASQDKEESWSSLYLAGQRIGFTRSIVETIPGSNGNRVKTFSESRMTIKRFGQSLVMKQQITTEETEQGDLVRFKSVMANPPASSTIMEGTIQGKELKLIQTINGKEKESKQEWRPEVKSPAFQDRILRLSPMKPGDSRSFEAFLPDFAKVAQIKLTAVNFEEIKVSDGSKQKLLKVTMTQSLVPGLVVVAWVDETGESIKTTTSMLGTEMVTFKVSKEEALKAVDGTELDLAVSTLVKTSRIPSGHASKKVVYRISLQGQNPENVIPSSAGQVVKKSGTDTTELTVIAIPVSKEDSATPVGDEFLADSQFLQRDDAKVQEHARKAAGDARDAGEIARRMEKYVQQNLTKKNFSTAMASAGEVAKTLEGDCTEHAVLLAAMLRAKGIPSRVAVGLVYVDSLSAFGGHMWTEAYLGGKWIPLDATLGLGGTGAAHIKLSDTSLSDDGPAAMSSFAPLMLVIGQLKLEVISAE